MFHSFPVLLRKLNQFLRWVFLCTSSTSVLQGIANAAGMAAAAKMAAAQFNTDKHTIFSNHIIALCGDGCMQVRKRNSSSAREHEMTRLANCYSSLVFACHFLVHAYVALIICVLPAPELLSKRSSRTYVASKVGAFLPGDLSYI